MKRRLLILEVSKKQNYIFASRKLKENSARSQQIRLVTESTFFREAAAELYNEAENLVYSGGGHAVLQFPDENSATAFAKVISSKALRLYPEIELYLRQIPYQTDLSPKENLKKLSMELERKKSMHKASFRWLSLGVEELNAESWRPEPEQITDMVFNIAEQIAPPEGMLYPLDFEQMNILPSSFGCSQREDNFLAVIHIDGNSMGTRVESLLENVMTWDKACQLLRCFSKSVDEDFNSAFRETVDHLLHCIPELRENKVLPIRPVIMAGDDVCFVSAGKIGLECARLYLEALSKKINAGDGKSYAACAGVALVHYKYPFHIAYRLSEELCMSAKRFGHSLDADGRVSAMDWHIEYGELKRGLREIREDYATEDGNRLELRPVTVVVPSILDPKAVDPTRTYSYFHRLCKILQTDCGKIAHWKLKNLRTALKQGETETRFYLADKQISNLLYHSFGAKNQNIDCYRYVQKQMFDSRVAAEKAVFSNIGGEDIKRSLFFDALEMMDHFEPLEVETSHE